MHADFTTKYCPSCKQDLPLLAFNKGNGAHGRQGYCRPCANVYRRERHDRERTSAAYRAANLERARKWAQDNPERANSRRQRYRRENPERDRVWISRSRAKKWGVENTLTIPEWLAIVERYRGFCAYCGDRFDTIDHVMPMSQGGGNTAENVVPACFACNSRKQDNRWEVPSAD